MFNSVVQFFSELRNIMQLSCCRFVSVLYNAHMQCNRKYAAPDRSVTNLIQTNFVFVGTFRATIDFWSVYFRIFRQAGFRYPKSFPFSNQVNQLTVFPTSR